MAKKARVVVITNDSLIAGLSEHNDAQANQIEYLYFQHIPHKAILKANDAIVYDIDATTQASEDVKRIKKDSNSKPLIVIGNRGEIQKLTSSRETKFMIDRALSKPVSILTFKIAISSIIKRKSRTKVINKTAERKHTLLLATAFLSMLFIVGVVMYGSLGGKPLGLLSDNDVAGSSSIPKISIPGSNRQIDTKQLDTEKLISSAIRAQALGNLAFPADMSALYYYQQALLIDRYHYDAYQGLQKILQEIRLSLPRLIDNGQLDQAEQLLNVLIETKPYAVENEPLIESLEKAKHAFIGQNKPDYREQGGVEDKDLPPTDSLESEALASKTVVDVIIND